MAIRWGFCQQEVTRNVLHPGGKQPVGLSSIICVDISLQGISTGFFTELLIQLGQSNVIAAQFSVSSRS